MFNYNVINPVNIHYRKYPQNEGAKNPVQKEGKSPLSTDENGGGQRRFPNGNKVAIDYTKNQINIAQVLQDFRSTIAAINSPDEVKEEVESYLGLVGKESQKSEPSREIVLSNLKNAARVTDKYIQESLKKPSRVVQDWVDALFLQKVNLKADPNEVNEEFRVKIPPKSAAPAGQNFEQNPEQAPAQFEQAPAQTGGIGPQAEHFGAPTEQYPAQSGHYTAPAQHYAAQTLAQAEHKGGLRPLNEDTVEFKKPAAPSDYRATESYVEAAPMNGENEIYQISKEAEEAAQKELQAAFEAEEEVYSPQPYSQPTEAHGLYAAKTEKEALAKEAVLTARARFTEDGDMQGALELCDEALSLAEGSENPNLKSAIYFERGKIFDSYDYPELALIDYNRATKGEDLNLKTQAHIKMGNIYDDYVQFEPALDQYSRAIETSEEANNPQGKTRALRYMASMFAGVYDSENTEAFSNLAIESAKETNNPKTIAKTYLEAARNYKYIGEDTKALQTYGALAQDEAAQEDYESMAQNYMEAAMLMDKKGNKKKSYALMLKSKEFQRLARLQRAE